MAIIRMKRASNFTVVSNGIFEAGKLAWDSRGLLCTLLSKPDEWNVIVKVLEKETENTRKHTKQRGIYEMLKELEEQGYVVRKKRHTGEVDYYIFDEPQVHETQIAEMPNCAKSKQRKTQIAEMPVSEKSNVLIRTDKNKQELNNKKQELNSASAGADTPTPLTNHNHIAEPKKQSKTETAKNKHQTELALLMAENVDRQLATDYLAVRKGKHSGTLTLTALSGLKREAAKAGLTLSDVLTRCCERGWVGFQADWATNSNPSPANRTNRINQIPKHDQSQSGSHLAKDIF